MTGIHGYKRWAYMMGIHGIHGYKRHLIHCCLDYSQAARPLSHRLQQPKGFAALEFMPRRAIHATQGCSCHAGLFVRLFMRRTGRVASSDLGNLLVARRRHAAGPAVSKYRPRRGSSTINDTKHKRPCRLQVPLLYLSPFAGYDLSGSAGTGRFDLSGSAP